MAKSTWCTWGNILCLISEFLTSNDEQSSLCCVQTYLGIHITWTKVAMLRLGWHMTTFIRTMYELYIGYEFDDQYKAWILYIWHKRFTVKVCAWIRGTQKSMPFVNHMAWQQQQWDLVTYCYYSLTNVSGCSTKNKEFIERPNMPPAIKPVPHDDSLPVPRPLETWIIEGADEDSTVHKPELEINNDPDFELLDAVSLIF